MSYKFLVGNAHPTIIIVHLCTYLAIASHLNPYIFSEDKNV
ncbi:MAG: hypothetical protein AB4426_26970 [Xenococcaceae cyanobacterium]